MIRSIAAGVLIIAALLGSSCSSDSDFEKGSMQLEAMGYHDVENTGWTGFCCSDSDDFSTGFTAKDKNGNEVKGCFCSSFLKGITIRFE